MLIHLIIRDLGGGQPVIQVTGTTGGNPHNFIWDAKRTAHVKTYDVSKPEELKTFRREQEAILNQKLAWPVLVDVTLEPDEMKDLSELEALKLELAVTTVERNNAVAQVKELQAQLPTPEVVEPEEPAAVEETPPTDPAPAISESPHAEAPLAGLEEPSLEEIPAKKTRKK